MQPWTNSLIRYLHQGMRTPKYYHMTNQGGIKSNLAVDSVPSTVNVQCMASTARIGTLLKRMILLISATASVRPATRVSIKNYFIFEWCTGTI